MGYQKEKALIPKKKGFLILVPPGKHTPKPVYRAIERDYGYHSCCAEPGEGWIYCR